MGLTLVDEVAYYQSSAQVEGENELMIFLHVDLVSADVNVKVKYEKLQVGPHISGTVK